MVNERFERTVDAKTWKTGNAVVITIPSTIVKRFRIVEGEMLEVTIKR